MTQWHLDWQDAVPPERREVTIGKHRADIVAPDGTVFEIQHSYLSVDDIQAREEFYGSKMYWVWDVREPHEAGRMNFKSGWGKNRRDGKWVKGTQYLVWKHARMTIASCRRPVVLDYGGDTLAMLLEPLAVSFDEGGRQYPPVAAYKPLKRQTLIERMNRDS